MKADQQIFQVALPVPLRRLFDYLPPDDHVAAIDRGMRVKVPFGRQTLVGIVMNQSTQSQIDNAQLKKIIEVCDTSPLLTENLCQFIEKAARYYHHPIGEVAFTGTPMAFRQGKTGKLKMAKDSEKVFDPAAHLVFNAEQQLAFDAILMKKNQFHSFLLEGITGSGKTEIYLQLAAKILSEQKQTLILVPEISLTPQTQQRFQERFGNQVICYHSKMTPAQRWQAWQKVQQQAAQIVVGTRSAIFLPFVSLGLIVIDEEHDPSFKQQEGFRYSARDIAVLRAQMVQCPIVLGSATPAFESIFNANTQKYQHLQLPFRATQSTLPTITLLDVRHKKCDGGLSAPLIQAIEKHLQQQGQVLLFINRRGYAPTFMCYQCSWIAQCLRCDARLTFHHHSQLLICHHCLYQCAAPTVCSSCQSTELNPVGVGTERLESVLAERFPDIAIARIDSDAVSKKGSLERLLTAAQENRVQILIGTQILAKGHHFPHLTLVAILDADGGLFSVDFRAVEHMAQLIIQVAGRAGRVHKAGEVIIQSCQPHHPLLQQILRQDYQLLAQILLKERAACHLPPYAHFALIRANALQPMLGHAVLQQVQSALTQLNIADVHILGPVPAPMLKRQGRYRYQLLLSCSQRKSLHQVLSYSTHILETAKFAKRVRWSLDVDPIEMI